MKALNHTTHYFGEKVSYWDRGSKSKEYFNGTRLQALVADYGYTGSPVPDDSLGPDFLFYRQSDGAMLAIQLKGRLTWKKDYMGKRIHIACPVLPGDPDGDWWIYPHDETIESLTQLGKTYFESRSWVEDGEYSLEPAPVAVADHMEQYRLRRGEA
jgi:hypothetical protein